MMDVDEAKEVSDVMDDYGIYGADSLKILFDLLSHAVAVIGPESAQELVTLAMFWDDYGVSG